MIRSSRRAALALLALTALLISGCERGPQLSVESRDLGEFRAVDFRGAGEINIEVGAPPALRIEGGSEAVKNLKAYVENGVLFVRPTDRHWNWLEGQHALTLNIAVPELKQLETNGAGNIHITGLRGGEHTLRTAGAFNIEARGSIERLRITLEGAGNVNYRDVVAQEAKVDLRGAGNVEVQPVKLLDAAVHGVGAVQYVGDPQKVESAVHGLGTIKPRKDRT